MRPPDMRSWLSVIILTGLVAGAAVAVSTPAGAEPSRDPSDVAVSMQNRSFTTYSSAEVAPGTDEGTGEDYDPWAPFNERTFAFNYGLDRHIMKPVAKAWNKVVPAPAQRALKDALHNVTTPKRFANSLLQGKVTNAARELGRLVINSTLGIGGLLDVATRAGLESRDTDFGQTLGVWGIGPGPYLVVPFLPPVTVRDGIGLAIDSLMNPLSLVAPGVAEIGMTAGKTVNERADNLQTFEDVEESVLDLYSAVRNGYLQRRQKAIKE
jgi:phospholipid-binding lipoprotein MlaA